MHTYHHIMSIPMDNMDVDFLRIEKNIFPLAVKRGLLEHLPIFLDDFRFRSPFSSGISQPATFD